MALAKFRQRLTCEGWQGENSAGVGKTLSRVRSGFQIAQSPICILTLGGLRRSFTYYLDPKNAGVLIVHC
jgi:hypothetical protein